MSQKGQTHFKNLVASVSDHFQTLCIEELSWIHFDNEPKVQERQQVKDQQSCIHIFVAYPIIPAQQICQVQQRR